MNRKLFRMKLTDQGSKEVRAHAVADTRMGAILTLRQAIQEAQGTCLTLEVEEIGEATVVEDDVPEPRLD